MRGRTARVLCYGDSLIAGYTMASPHTQEYAPWAPLLAEKLGVPVDPIGMSGWTTRQMLSNLDAVSNTDVCDQEHPGLRQLLRRTPSYTHVVLMAGTNDLGVVSGPDIASNLIMLHNVCHAAGVRTIALSIPHCKATTVGPSFVGERRREANEAIKQFAASKPDWCIHVEVDLLWERGSTDFEPDGLHLSEAGYARFASMLSDSPLSGFIHGSVGEGDTTTVAEGPFGPVAMQRLRVSDELVQYLLLDNMQSCTELAMGRRGFDACVDYPDIEGHTYWEGYFHSESQAGSVTSVHPRKGCNFEKPAAPWRLRAFLGAVRAVNSGWLERLGAAGSLPDEFASLLTHGRAFSDLAVQVHHGAAITPSDARFHMDGINSCLHLALSLRGQRSLLCKLSDTPGEGASDRTFDFSSGDVYISCPWAFPHGVAYPQCDWESRVVAVQCRLLFTRQEEEQLESRPDLARCLLPAITEAIASGTLRMPSLAEVEAEAARRSLGQASPWNGIGMGISQAVRRGVQLLTRTLETIRPPPVMDASALAEMAPRGMGTVTGVSVTRH